jgi:hypothetical protein
MYKDISLQPSLNTKVGGTPVGPEIYEVTTDKAQFDC